MTRFPDRLRYATPPPAVQATLALVVVLAWAACFVVIKGSLEQAPPLFYAALRALVAGVPLLGIAAACRRFWPPRGTWAWLAALGLGNTFLGFAGMFLSVGEVGAAIPGVLANTQPLLVAPFACLFFGEELTGWKVIGLAVGLAGVTLTAAHGAMGLGRIEGALFALLAAAGVAGGSLIIKHIGFRVDFLTATAWQYVLGSLPLLAWALAAEDLRGITWRPGFVLGLLFLGLVGSAGASLLWYLLVTWGELIRLTACTFLTPVFALLLATLVFREGLRPIGILGISLTIAGVACVVWSGPGRTPRRVGT